MDPGRDDRVVDRPGHRREKENNVEGQDPAVGYSDDPFGNEENAEVKYKTMSWW